MMRKLSDEFKQWRSTVFVLCNLVILAAGLCAAIPIYELVGDRDSQIAERLGLLARLRSVAARETDVQAAAQRAEEQPDQGEFLSGPNDGVIGADLQTRLKTIADRSAARVRTMQGLPTRSRAP